MSQPKRLELKDTNRLNLWEAGALHFSKPDFDRTAVCSMRMMQENRGTMTTVLNAANEIAWRNFSQAVFPLWRLKSI
nr:hypothetical protein [Sinobaca sp. H24]